MLSCLPGSFKYDVISIVAYINMKKKDNRIFVLFCIFLIAQIPPCKFL